MSQDNSFRRNFLLWTLAAALIVAAGYRFYVLSAVERFREQCHLQGQNLANETAARVRLVDSALKMFCGDPHLATYLAAGGELPPYARARIEPAIRLLSQNLPVDDWAVSSFATTPPRLMVQPRDAKLLPTLHALQTEWAGSRDRRYQVRQAGSLVLYAAPVIYRDDVYGAFVLALEKRTFLVPTPGFVAGLREAGSGVEVSSLPDSDDQLYAEVFPVNTSPTQGTWQLSLRRPDGLFWDSPDLFVARLTAALSFLALWLAGLSVMGSLSRRAALIASRAKSDLLSQVSHEIRNPLTGILGLTHRSLETELPPQQKDDLRAISRSASSVLGLLDDLLDHSQIEAGVLDFTPLPVSPRSVVLQAIETFTAMPGRDRVKLTYELAADLPQAVLADPLRLRQLLVNLVGNAVKFTHQGEVKVSAKLCGHDEKGRAILYFGVSDTGIGIPSDQLETIFQAFHQVQPGGEGGAGLGLAISRELASRMDGRIWVESELGKGSTFHVEVRLPLADPPRPTGQVGPAVGEGLRILLAEDGEINAKLGSSLLEELGHEVAVAKDGTQVLSLLDGQRFDLILMDLAMPNLDGLRTTREIRARGHADLPILALTGSAQAQDKKRCLEAGMNGHVVKPLTERNFARALANLGVRP
jgi:signal transduction histidine kinase/CheY-like chemotaxis protein